MRLFLDANVMTYIAFFEAFLTEGTVVELRSDVAAWRHLQRGELDDALLREILALRVLYMVDEAAHFDWAFSDLALIEISRIRDNLKREAHYNFLIRLLEHCGDVYEDARIRVSPEERERTAVRLFGELPSRMVADANQFAEACLVDADYFVTNDADLIKLRMRESAPVQRARPSELPFVASELQRPTALLWATEIEAAIRQITTG